jgi:hypothetical protein
MISYDDIKSGKAAMPVAKTVAGLPALVAAAAAQLATAKTAAEVLDAKDKASLIYDAAKRAARLAAAKGAHDTLVAEAHRAQANALKIEAAAKERLADEYDAAQPEDAAVAGRPKKSVPDENAFSAKAVGLTRKQVHEARQVRDAELAQPGIVRQTLDDKLAAGEEPTRAAVNAAVAKVFGKTQPVDARTIEDREFDDLQNAWDAAGEIARGRFLQANSLGMASVGLSHSADGANAGGEDVDRSASRASSAVQLGATNSPERAEFQAKANEDACAVGQDDARAEVKSEAPGGAELASRGVSDRALTATTENGRDSVERHAPVSQLDGGAFVAVKGKARLANADSVEPSLSNANSPATVQTRQADKAEAVTPPAVSAAPFNNPRCQHADTCHFAKERDCCHDCLMAWSKRPKDEQVRLWAEANEAARAAI